MENLFSEQTYYQFPSLEAAVYALLLSFLLSTIIALTYKYTFRGTVYNKDFFQAVVLISIIAATVMMAIGDSLARGLGILGALAIIRFRFRFENPKNIIYIFASLAIGIGCGVHGFAVAVAGTAVFSVVSFALYFSPVGKAPVYDTSLSFLIDDPSNISAIESLLSEYCQVIKLISIGNSNELIKYEYQITLKKGADRYSIFTKLNDVENVSNVRINNRPSIDRV